MTPASEPTAKVLLRAPGPGAYRLQVLGKDPRKVVNHVLAGQHSRRVVELEPGTYTALFEAIGLFERRVQTIKVKSNGVEGAIAELSDATVVETPPQFVNRSRIATDGDQERVTSEDRRFSVGISTERGGWTSAPQDVRLSQDLSGGEIRLEVDRPAEWPDDPKRRLTIAVEGHPPWRMPLPLFQDGLSILFSQDRTGKDLDVRVAPQDPATAALVGSLERLSAAEARRVARASVGATNPQLVDALINKQNDPWAATAAALILAREDETGDAFWAPRLASLFPWLADGAIVAAAAAATDKSDPAQAQLECISFLADAERRGTPYFRVANDLAISLLNGLFIGASSPEIRAEAMRLRDAWAETGRRSLKSGFLMSWEGRGDNLTDGELPSESYALVAHGRLSKAGIKLQAQALPA